jgi:hypothetical protein
MELFYNAGSGITTYTNNGDGTFSQTGYKSDEELLEMGRQQNTDLSNGGGGGGGNGGIGGFFKKVWRSIFGGKEKSSVVAEDMGSAELISDSDVATIAELSFKEAAIVLKQQALLGILTNQNLITYTSQTELLGANILVYNKEKLAYSKVLAKYGSYAGKAGNALTAFDIMYSTYLYQTGEITRGEYSYKMAGTISSIIVGAAFGGPAGLAVGVAFTIGEALYNQYHDYNSVQNQSIRQIRASFNWNAYNIMQGFRP